MRRLSDLEEAVLGVVWLNQPCTAYVVRRCFDASLSAQWSGSAGAIYPVLRRLEEGGLIESTPVEGDARGAREHRLARAGLERLRAWVARPLEGGEAADSDPVRRRLRFLAALPPAKRRLALDRMEASIATFLEDVRRAHAASKHDGDDPMMTLAHRGAWLTAEARLRLIREARDALDAGAL